MEDMLYTLDKSMPIVVVMICLVALFSCASSERGNTRADIPPVPLKKLDHSNIKEAIKEASLRVKQGSFRNHDFYQLKQNFPGEPVPLVYVIPVERQSDLDH